MPPPNANGSLHIGHALGLGLSDLMVRFERMRGKSVLLLPGLDHAGFETQVVFEKELKKTDQSRFDFKNRPKTLYKKIWQFTKKNRRVVEAQIRRLGVSCDWSKLSFTLDEPIVKIVYQTFKRLADDGLVYQSSRLVNWCVVHQTGLSDLEVFRLERKSPLYYIRFGPLTVATTRPETLFGDVAVAVHPSDKRYRRLVGKKAKLPLLDRELPIIADQAVDPTFGTGAVKITPHHDFADSELAERHRLAKTPPVIDRFGRMTDQSPEKYRGLKVSEARERVVEDLEKAGLLEKTDQDYRHLIGVCYKCRQPLEPIGLAQWYIAVDKRPRSGGRSLKERGLLGLKRVKILPRRQIGILKNFFENLRDWNISRQIVWGIPLPIWHCRSVGKKGSATGGKTAACPPIITDGQTPKTCPNCDGKKLKRETDVFDTWFSSGLWPVATLKVHGLFDKFYPSSVMETGYDILFFWVGRMMILGHYLTGQFPFGEVYLHGLVRDKDRQKMSKSRGNVLDPLGVIDQFGADGLKLALVFGAGIGRDVAISEEKIRGMRNFANKIWNISRFILINLEESGLRPKGLKIEVKTQTDRELDERLKKTVQRIGREIESRRFHLAAEIIYRFAFEYFAPKYLETSKKQLAEKRLKGSTENNLLVSLTTVLKLLHPLMPSLTETIWQELRGRRLVKEPLLIAAGWPSSQGLPSRSGTSGGRVKKKNRRPG